MKNGVFLTSFLLLAGVFLAIGVVAPNVFDQVGQTEVATLPTNGLAPEVLGETAPVPIWSSSEPIRYVSRGYSVSFEHPAATVVNESHRRIAITEAPNGPEDESVYFLHASLNFTPYSTIDEYLKDVSTDPAVVQIERGTRDGRNTAVLSYNVSEAGDAPAFTCKSYLVENRQTLIALIGHECTPVESIWESLEFLEI